MNKIINLFETQNKKVINLTSKINYIYQIENNIKSDLINYYLNCKSNEINGNQLKSDEINGNLNFIWFPIGLSIGFSYDCLMIFRRCPAMFLRFPVSFPCEFPMVCHWIFHWIVLTFLACDSR